MSEQSRQRRLRVDNRLEELRAKYGHEHDWLEVQELSREDALEARVNKLEDQLMVLKARVEGTVIRVDLGA